VALTVVADGPTSRQGGRGRAATEKFGGIDVVVATQKGGIAKITARSSAECVGTPGPTFRSGASTQHQRGLSTRSGCLPSVIERKGIVLVGSHSARMAAGTGTCGYKRENGGGRALR